MKIVVKYWILKESQLQQKIEYLVPIPTMVQMEYRIMLIITSSTMNLYCLQKMVVTLGQLKNL